jgi:hypothetical protein
VLTGAVAIGFGLLHRELAKGYPDDITDGLGLTADQLDRVKDRTVTMGDTWAATIDVMGKYLTQGPIGDGLDWLNKRWNAWLDDLTKNTVNEVAVIVGFSHGRLSGHREQLAKPAGGLLGPYSQGVQLRGRRR